MLSRPGSVLVGGLSRGKTSEYIKVDSAATVSDFMKIIEDWLKGLKVVGGLATAELQQGCPPRQGCPLATALMPLASEARDKLFPLSHKVI